MKRNIIGIFKLTFFFYLIVSCGTKSSESEGIPVDLEFEGEIAKYYSVQKAVVKFEEKEKDGLGNTNFRTSIVFELVRNDEPFILDPSKYNYAGSAVVGLGSDPKSGTWCMFVDIMNEQYDDVGTYCGNARKLFEHFTTTGDVCRLSFETTISDIFRKGNIDDVKEFLDGKQNFHFILKGLLNENGNSLNSIEKGDIIADGNYIYDGLWQSSKYKSQPCQLAFEKKGKNIYNSRYTNLRFNTTTLLKGCIEGDSLFFEGNIKGGTLVIHLAGDETHLSGTGCDYAHKDTNVILEFNRNERRQISSEDISASHLAGSTDWDDILDSYEQFVDKYILYSKKVSKGDMNALSEYSELMEQAMDYFEKLDKARGDLSMAQLARLNRLALKMASVADEKR